MKRLIFYIFFVSLMIQACGQTNVKTDTNGIYSNSTFRFSVLIPNDWKLAGEMENERKTIVCWTLPAIYSDIEKTEIENAISITAHKSTYITSVSDLILSEYLRIDPVETALEYIDESNKNARMIYTTTPQGLKYKGKSYFVFNHILQPYSEVNGIGYIITFMATPGTFDKNIDVFEEFYKSINYN